MDKKAIIKLTSIIVVTVIQVIIYHRKKYNYKKRMTDTMRFICAVAGWAYLADT